MACLTISGLFAMRCRPTAPPLSCVPLPRMPAQLAAGFLARSMCLALRATAGKLACGLLYIARQLFSCRYANARLTCQQPSFDSSCAMLVQTLVTRTCDMSRADDDGL